MNNAIALKIMLAARRLIWFKRNWTQRQYVELGHRNQSVAWCAVGAIRHAIGDLHVENHVHYELGLGTRLDRMAEIHKCDSIVFVNDQSDADKAHRQVINLFNRLIKELQPPTPEAPPLAPAELHEVEKVKEEENA